MNDEQHIPIRVEQPAEPHAAPTSTASAEAGTDPVYTELPGGEGVQSGEEGEMPTVTQTVEYGRFSEAPCAPAPGGPVPADQGMPGEGTPAATPVGAPAEGTPAATPGGAPGEGARAEGVPAEGAPTADSAADDGSWQEVVASLTVLGDSISRWARASVRDPNYERHAEELKGALRNVAGKMNDAVDEVNRSEVAQGFREAAVKTGGAIYETGQRVYRDAVAPGLADAFRGAAEGLRIAAQRLEESRERAQAAAEEARAHSASAPSEDAEGEVPTDAEPGIEPPDPTEI